MATSTMQLNRSSASLSSAEWIRTFMLVQAATFVLAATLHLGLIATGYADLRAGIPESVIASVLLAGLIATWVRPAAIRGIALAAQGFALAGTLVGVFTIVIGIGPRTVPDLVIHPVMVMELVAGMAFAYMSRVTPARSSA